MKDIHPEKIDPQNITLTPFNHYTNLSFQVELSFTDSE